MPEDYFQCRKYRIKPNYFICLLRFREINLILAAIKHRTMTITGKKFEVDFGAKAVLHIQSETTLSFQIREIDGKPTAESETVEIKITPLRPKLFMLTWKEKNGNTVTQIQDHQKQLVYMNWTWPDGNFVHAQGTIKPIN